MRLNETGKSMLNMCKNNDNTEKLEKTVSFVSKVSLKMRK